MYRFPICPYGYTEFPIYQSFYPLPIVRTCIIVLHTWTFYNCLWKKVLLPCIHLDNNFCKGVLLMYLNVGVSIVKQSKLSVSSQAASKVHGSNLSRLLLAWDRSKFGTFSYSWYEFEESLQKPWYKIYCLLLYELEGPRISIILPGYDISSGIE